MAKFFLPMLAYMPEVDPRAAAIESGLERIRKSKRWLAERLNTSNKNVGNWLSGSNVPREEHGDVFDQMLEAIQDFEENRNKNPDEIKLQKMGVRVIQVYTGISAGPPDEPYGDAEPLQVMDWGTDRKRWGRKVKGFSMHDPKRPDEGLRPDDIVIFEDREWEPGHVVQAFDKGKDTIKVARGFGASVRLIPMNGEYPVLDGKTWKIKGVVVERRRKDEFGNTHILIYEHGMRSDADRRVSD